MRELALVIAAFAIPSCTVGPKYVKPDTADITPAKWKWKSASPRDDAPKGEWWTVFKDKELNRLQALAVANNNDLRAAAARLDQALAATRVGAAGYSPSINFSPSANRERTSSNPPSPVPIKIPSAQINTFSVPLVLSYELDLWGKIRRGVEGAKAQADGAAADGQNLLLTLTGEVAAVYFQLCALNDELAALTRTLELRAKSANIIEQRFKAGVLPEVDAARARSELATTKAEMADVKRQKAELVANLALLCGQPASDFSVADKSYSGSVPGIPIGAPADLVERRPDVASAERKVAALNAQIGVEKAGFFPAVQLIGQGGFLSKEASGLLTAENRVWSLGPGISLPISGYFLTKAKVARATAAREEAIAGYRQAVLTAIKDVEVSLSAIHFRTEQAGAEAEAVKAAQQALELVRSRYEGGTVSYLELIDAERTSLALERQASQVKAQRLIATVRLIKALGGRW